MLFKLANLGLNKPIVILLDNARYHKFKLIQIYATSVGIQLCYLPCYSPQLNLALHICGMNQPNTGIYLYLKE
ncbi:Mobile element protein [Richelia intracellularis]|nr:Mobile element protein [Richelia intracellularis]